MPRTRRRFPDSVKREAADRPVAGTPCWGPPASQFGIAPEFVDANDCFWPKAASRRG